MQFLARSYLRSSSHTSAGKMCALHMRCSSITGLRYLHKARPLVLHRRNAAAGEHSSLSGKNESVRPLRAAPQCTASPSAQQQSASGQSGVPASGKAEAVSFEIQRIPGDGSCLFRALAAGQHLAETGNFLRHSTARLFDHIAWQQDSESLAACRQAAA